MSPHDAADTHDTEADVDPATAVVDALLREQLGGERAPDLAAAVATRWRRGDGPLAARRVVDAGAGRVPAGPTWLAAALVLLGATVVVALASWRRPAPTPPAAPPQDPVVCEVESIAHLRELLPTVTGVRMEPWFLIRSRIDLRAAPPFAVAAESVRAITAALATDDREDKLQVVKATGWKWTNRVLLDCRDGRSIVLALDRASRGRLGMRGLQGDLVLTNVAPLARAMLAAEAAACQHLGVVRARHDLAEGSPFRTAKTLTFAANPDPDAAVRPQDLAALAAFADLRAVDLGELAPQADAAAVAAIAAVPQLERAVLDGAPVDDDALRPLADKASLRELSLRGCTALRGDAFAQAVDGPAGLPFASLQQLTLSQCTALRPATLPNLGAMRALRELRLDGAALPTADTPWRIFAGATQVAGLDVSEHPLGAEHLRDLASITTLRRLALRQCDLDDDAIAAFRLRCREGIKDRPSAPEDLDLRQNGRLTIAAVRGLIADIPTLRELDLGGCAAIAATDLDGLPRREPPVRIRR